MDKEKLEIAIENAERYIKYGGRPSRSVSLILLEAAREYLNIIKEKEKSNG